MEKDTYVVVTSTVHYAGIVIPTSIRTVLAYDRENALDKCKDMDGDVVFCGPERTFLGKWGELRIQPLTKFDVRHAVKEALKEMKEEKRIKSTDAFDCCLTVLFVLAVVFLIAVVLSVFGVIG